MKKHLLALWRAKYVRPSVMTAAAILLAAQAFNFALELKGSPLPPERYVIDSASLSGDTLSVCHSEQPRLSSIDLLPAERSRIVADAQNEPWVEITRRPYLFLGGTATELVTLHLRSYAELKGEPAEHRQMLADLR